MNKKHQVNIIIHTNNIIEKTIKDLDEFLKDVQVIFTLAPITRVPSSFEHNLIISADTTGKTEEQLEEDIKEIGKLANYYFNKGKLTGSDIAIKLTTYLNDYADTIYKTLYLNDLNNKNFKEIDKMSITRKCNGNLKIVTSDNSSEENLIKLVEFLQQAQNTFNFETNAITFDADGCMIVPLFAIRSTKERLEKDLNTIRDIVINHMNDEVKPKEEFRLVFSIHSKLWRSKKLGQHTMCIALHFDNKKLKEEKMLETGEVINNNIAVTYEIERESNDGTYEISISGPEIDENGLPYIGINSPEDSIMTMSVYDTKDDVIRLICSTTKKELEDYFNTTFNTIKWTADIEDGIVKSAATDAIKERIFHEQCLDSIYNTIYAMVRYNVNNIDMKHDRIHSYEQGSTIYVPYTKATYKVDHPYKLVEEEIENSTVNVIYDDRENSIKNATVIVKSNDNTTNKFIPLLKERKQLEEYNYLIEKITDKPTHKRSKYSIEAFKVNLDEGISSEKPYKLAKTIITQINREKDNNINGEK